MNENEDTGDWALQKRLGYKNSKVKQLRVWGVQPAESSEIGDWAYLALC